MVKNECMIRRCTEKHWKITMIIKSGASCCISSPTCLSSRVVIWSTTRKTILPRLIFTIEKVVVIWLTGTSEVINIGTWWWVSYIRIVGRALCTRFSLISTAARCTLTRRCAQWTSTTIRSWCACCCRRRTHFLFNQL